MTCKHKNHGFCLDCTIDTILDLERRITELEAENARLKEENAGLDKDNNELIKLASVLDQRFERLQSENNELRTELYRPKNVT